MSETRQMIGSKLAKLTVAAAFLLGTMLMLSACNTIEGVGEDIAAGARTVKKAFN